jgi:hypothetical protein
MRFEFFTLKMELIGSSEILVTIYKKYYSVMTQKITFHYNLYSSPNIESVIKSVRMRWVRQVACMGERVNAYRILIRDPLVKVPLERSICGWKDNLKLDLK